MYKRYQIEQSISFILKSIVRIYVYSKVIRVLPWKFIEVAHRHGCSPVNLLQLFKTHFPKNTLEGLLLKQTLNSNNIIFHLIKPKKIDQMRRKWSLGFLPLRQGSSSEKVKKWSFEKRAPYEQGQRNYHCKPQWVKITQKILLSSKWKGLIYKLFLIF